MTSFARCRGHTLSRKTSNIMLMKKMPLGGGEGGNSTGDTSGKAYYFAFGDEKQIYFANITTFTNGIELHIVYDYSMNVGAVTVRRPQIQNLKRCEGMFMQTQ